MTQGFYAGMGGYCFDIDLRSEFLDYESYSSVKQHKGKSNADIEPSSLYQSMRHEFYDNKGIAGNAGLKHRQLYNKEGRAGSAGPKRRQLTARGCADLCGFGKLSMAKEQSILDRSKSDLLAKSLVCLQAGYMIVQCVSRLANKLPLTFLEINTLGHVICAIVMYSFWFNKPQAIRQSLPLDAELARNLSPYAWAKAYSLSSPNPWEYWAFFSGDLFDLYSRVWKQRERLGQPHLIVSQMGSSKVHIDDSLSLSVDQANSRVTTLDTEQRRSKEGSLDTFRLKDPSISSAPSIYHRDPTREEVASFTETDAVLVVEYSKLTATEASEFFLRTEFWGAFCAIYCVSGLTDMNRDPGARKLCTMIYGCDLPTLELFVPLLIRAEIEPLDYRVYWVEEEIPNWPRGRGLLEGHTVLPPLAISLTTALYGGLHAAAWNSYFPTSAEMWLWRVCSAMIAGSGIYVAFAMAMNEIFYHLDFYSVRYRRGLNAVPAFLLDCFRIEVEYWSGNIQVDTSRTCRNIRMAIIYTLGTLCVFSRLFLVVESFVSLRKVPVAVYQTPDWTQWIPHL